MNSILIVDDEPEICMALNDHFQSCGYGTAIANNGIEALSVLLEQPIQLIMLDILMPIMDGFETLEMLKATKRYDAIPVIMLTAFCGPANLDKALELGVDFILPKPFDFNNLDEYIKAVIE
jgi:two-component system, OmpR family, alkaline phosphatase synthesis response regulator PhoP